LSGGVCDTFVRGLWQACHAYDKRLHEESLVAENWTCRSVVSRDWLCGVASCASPSILFPTRDVHFQSAGVIGSLECFSLLLVSVVMSTQRLPVTRFL